MYNLIGKIYFWQLWNFLFCPSWSMISSNITLCGLQFQSSYNKISWNFMGSKVKIQKNMSWKFHLCCSSNSLMDDSICLRLFHLTLTDTAAKWYIELPQHLFVDFSSLETIFLTHFQLPICYEMGTDLLTSLCQNTSMHILNHIHEWRRQRWLIKAPILDQILADWFTKSLLPPIA